MRYSPCRVWLLAILLPLLVPEAIGQPSRSRGPAGATGQRLAPEELSFEDGVATIADRETFERLSYQGPDVLIDTHLAGQQFVKFQIEDADSDNPQLYFINTKTHRAHMMFMRVAGLPMRMPGSMRGVLVYHPRRKSPAGDPGLYTYEFEPFDSFPFAKIQLCNDLLIEKMPILKDRVGYYPMPRALAQYEQDKELYANSDVRVFLDEDIEANIGYLPLNMAESYGRLRRMKPGERPSPRDIVLYASLPNELSRVAGIITAVRQTPLSHVNLRAVQDGVPNAFIAASDDNDKIRSLLGKTCYYKVDADGYVLRPASAAEAEAYFANLRPAEAQIPSRDLSVRTIRSLDEIRFEDSNSVGVKAANLAALRSFGFPEGTVPAGFAVPFYFYDEFMKHNGLYRQAQKMLADPAFQENPDTQISRLKKFRRKVRQGSMPDWMMEALAAAHASFPAGQSVRCRSSTNNEDLPGFSGAGLYDSFTHHPHEGHLSKSIRQVYASLWNYRAFEERDFYRIDHLAAAMGVLMHPNYSGERANGVAVTDDILYQTQGNYYLNTQVGEDLVTNPGEVSVPEEVLLGWRKSDPFKVMRYSNHTGPDEQLLKPEHLELMRRYLGVIHTKFSKLYGVDLQEPGFAMEIEYKITRDGVLAIKQARPWVFVSKP